MKIIHTEIPDLVQLELDAFEDERGFFLETWRDTWAKQLKQTKPFIQDNHARSEAKGVLRGLHYQNDPHSQAKLVWVTRGAVYDVAVDLREGSPTYHHWCGLVLSETNRLRFFIPPGFAHGYITLEEGTEFHYKVDAYYHPASEGGIRWDDPELGIQWPEIPPILSAKDKELPLVSSLKPSFVYRKKR
ncbi:dTDP-4-dehydrorhamnose 3,5-epimerase [Desulfovibrio sp. OttesenSCG-928-G15]|nr:dTDP-4-dehydrorhamnose 3,5-epimerase [Desulfovibrio sp. OttesenSCG-928-G15]